MKISKNGSQYLRYSSVLPALSSALVSASKSESGTCSKNLSSWSRKTGEGGKRGWVNGRTGSPEMRPIRLTLWLKLGLRLDHTLSKASMLEKGNEASLTLVATHLALLDTGTSESRLFSFGRRRSGRGRRGHETVKVASFPKIEGNETARVRKDSQSSVRVAVVEGAAGGWGGRWQRIKSPRVSTDIDFLP